MNLEEQKRFKTFLILYNISLPCMVLMLLIRGVTQVWTINLSRGADAAISGIAGITGITHILMLVSFITLFGALKKAIE